VPDYTRAIFREVTDRGPAPLILTGPIAVSGAQPGDVLEVRILAIELAVDYGFNRQRPYAGALPEEFPGFFQRIIKINRGAKTAEVAPGVVVPLDRPFFGTMGVAPLPSMGRISAAPPGVHSGNMDNKDLVAGTTLFMQVYSAGALFSVAPAGGRQEGRRLRRPAFRTPRRAGPPMYLFRLSYPSRQKSADSFERVSLTNEPGNFGGTVAVEVEPIKNWLGVVALVTRANRGLGRAFVRGLQDAGALKVYAAARDPAGIAGTGDRMCRASRPRAALPGGLGVQRARMDVRGGACSLSLRVRAHCFYLLVPSYFPVRRSRSRCSSPASDRSSESRRQGTGKAVSIVLER
jgi:Acetamidase/Formamidase family